MRGVVLCTLAVCVTVVLCHFQVLAELKEYATEVDVDFVRKAVRAIGRCAIKVEVRNALIFSAACFISSDLSPEYIITKATIELIFTQEETKMNKIK